MMTKARNSQAWMYVGANWGLVKTQVAGPRPGVADSEGLRWGLENLHSYRFPGAAAAAAGPQTRRATDCGAPMSFYTCMLKNIDTLVAWSCCQANMIRSELGLQRPVLLFFLPAVWQLASHRTSGHLRFFHQRQHLLASHCLPSQACSTGQWGKDWGGSPQPERH